MTEKLTYDPTPADAPEFTEDEQNSLEVAEKLGAEEAKQYAGKFDNAEELENAYIELQKKLGSNDEDTEVDTLEETEEEVSPGVSLITDASNEYYANEGKLSEETIEKFSSMSSKDLVSAYMDIVKNNPQDQAAPAQDIADADINRIKNGVGGEKQYDNMIRWADQNLDKQASEAFDNVVGTGNVQMIQLAVAGLKAQYDEANGYEGRMLSGKSPLKSGDTYQSQPELVAAMSDPRYDNDPAYRRAVMEKLDRSDMSF